MSECEGARGVCCGAHTAAGHGVTGPASGFAANPFHGRAKCLPMLGEIKT